MLRLELQLILWVTASAFAGVAIFHGSDPPAQLLLNSGKHDPVATREPASIAVVVALPDNFIDFDSTPIFEAPGAPATELVPDVVTDQSVTPVLKGIVSSEAGLRAVFAAPSDAYMVLALGDRLADLTIISISEEQVVARDGAGRDSLFPLRGLGEN